MIIVDNLRRRQSFCVALQLEIHQGVFGLRIPCYKYPLIDGELKLRGSLSRSPSLRRRQFFFRLHHVFLTENTFSQCKSPPISKKIACGALVTIKHTGSNQHINMSICWLQVEISEISGKKSIWWKDDMRSHPKKRFS